MLVAALAFTFNCSFARAADKEENAPSAEEQMAALVKLGPGVHNIKKDKKGRVLTLIVVGQARISTVLGGAKGKEMARKKAAQGARAEFVKWLGEAVVVCENAENEATIFIQGEEGKDKDAQSEAGKAVEKTGDSFKSLSAGFVRGLTLLHTDVNADEKECTMVYGWSLANAKAAKHTATNDPTIEDDKPAAKKAASREAAEGGESGKSDNKKIRSQKATSGDAGDFLK
jgi:hypothetical protein